MPTNDQPVWTRLRQIADRLERKEPAGQNVAFVFFSDFYDKTNSSALCIDGEIAGRQLPHPQWARNALALLKDRLAEIV